ncbi:putative hydroxyacid-oxoacid transhydrogenase, mitochondrial [Melipona quadrifasciata]|uniref:hydroxyacid-oxoacid transhydrogenase n=1 Tax=Melipona quadrifasciata TaxID=166423 RepID=A0A0M8ZY77_9HYME|nr:putative hydroxyacid-oxoacid transhydrogenase, mitochondrial [Melipona quadrifasciata]
MACSTIRYGVGVTKELGMDMQNFGSKNVCLMTDSNLINLPPIKTAMDSLTKYGIQTTVYDKVRVEPTEESLKDSIEFAKRGQFDAFIAVRNKHTCRRWFCTCKAANLYSCDPHAEFLDYVNEPIGKGKPITIPLKPLIAVPTTSGTGSETTGLLAIIYFENFNYNRALRPTLGLVDPNHTLSMPERVCAFSGFDVLCHALESFTAIPYTERDCAPNPILRPAYQGSNAISDVWAKYALQIMRKYIINLHSYNLLYFFGFSKKRDHKNHALIPHGLSVVISAPAIFSFLGQACPERHLEAAELLGTDISRAKKSDAGKILADTVREYMQMMKIENGLAELGYKTEDIPTLVKGTLPQVRSIIMITVDAFFDA